MHSIALLVLAAVALASAANSTSYKASFTEYGSGDDNGSGNCNVLTCACGYYTEVSISPNLFLLDIWYAEC